MNSTPTPKPDSTAAHGASGAHHFLQGLTDLGIEHVFANLGTDHVSLIEELARWDAQGKPHPQFILCPHENVAIHMAAGYAALTGQGQAVMILQVDLHSGGSSLNYIPSALARMTGEKKRDAKVMALLEAFAAPVSYITNALGENRTSTAAAERVGTLIIGTELGGKGTVDIDGTRVAVNGVRGVLEHMGIVKETDITRKRPKTRVTEVRDVSYYAYAPQPGLFEPVVKLGANVKKGQTAGFVHFMDDPGREPVEVKFQANGFVLCERIPGKVERGDCLFHLASDVK